MKRCILPGVILAPAPTWAFGQAIYPLDRATIMSGSKFDFKVEFPTVVAQDAIEVLINGESYDKLLGATADYIEDEDGSGGSTLILRDVSITAPGEYTVEAKAGEATKTVGWEVFGTGAEPKAKNVIFFLGDGMTVAHRTAARILSKGNTEGKADGRLAIDDLQYMAFVGTSSQDSIHNDSANTMAAYMTGHKSVVNALGVYGSRAESNFDHPKVETMGEAIRRHTDKALGIVTNTEVQDATPAAIVSHTVSRNDKAEITEMHLAVEPDLLFGGGSAYFLPQATPGSKRKDDKDMIAAFKDKGYALATSATELSQAVTDHQEGGKILGLFNTGNLDTTLDIRQLKKGTVADFPDQPLVADRLVPDTLIVFVGDHTHGLSITGTVDDDKPGEEMREKVGTYQHAGFTNYTDEDGDGYPDRMDVSKRLMMYLGNFPDHYETFRPKLDGQFVPAVQDADGKYVANEAYNIPGAVLRVGNIPTDINAGTHSIDDEVLQADGPGAEGFRGYMENSDVYRVLAEAMALAPAAN